MLLRPVADPWPFADGQSSAPHLVQAVDILEVAVEQGTFDQSQAQAAWELIEAHAAMHAPSWHRATRPPRAGPKARLRVLEPPRAPRAPSLSRTEDADTLAALLFVVAATVRRGDLVEATGWTPPRLAGAADTLIAQPPRGLQVQVDGDRLTLVTDGAVSRAVERLLARFGRGELLQPLKLADTVWLVLGVVVLEQPITRAEVSARRLADSDRQVQLLLQHRLVREEPRAALPGRGIPLVTTDLLLRRLGVGSLSELQQRILSQPPEIAGLGPRD